MRRLAALEESDLDPSIHEHMRQGKELMGFVSNDAMTMARKPKILSTFLGLVQAIYEPGETESSLKRLVGLMASASAGCQYCVAHTVTSAARLGIEEEKLNKLWEFETSSLFSEVERVALRVAMHAAQVPNGVTDEIYAEFAQHYSEEQQTELIAVISLFGFLNRWNSTLATDLEMLPKARSEEIGLQLEEG